ncbi:hypothetical protein [Roseibium album]|uniref:hypothetical protein n=1 Tax=Roseibium album TaxID=311410 RepID=UPI000D557FD8
MPVSVPRLNYVWRVALWVLNIAILIAVLATGYLVYIERGWAKPIYRDAPQAFRNGTIGTEVMPLPVALVLPDLFPHHFQPGGQEAGNWVEQFGFLDDPDNPDGLPVGFTTTNYRPQTAAPSPVPFVALTCALCHTTEFSTSDGAEPVRLLGPGSVSINLFAWLDAFQSSLIERMPTAPGEPVEDAPFRLTVPAIMATYEEKTGKSLSLPERIMTGLWLRQIRERLLANIERFDEPYGNGRSRDEDVTPTGPTRTLAFRTLLRNVMHYPANNLPIHSKIATIYNQGWRERAQFDGSVSNVEARSSLAAVAAGATEVNLAHPEIVHNIREAIAYTISLAPPKFQDLFPEAGQPDPGAVQRGRQVYRNSCMSCHGDRSGEGWEPGERTHEVIPLSEIGTDPERVMFRHYGEMPDALHAYFPKEHPFAFARDEVHPQPQDADNLAIRGYVAGPVDGAFLRAPFLHNASILTLAELINLEPRRAQFYRGWNTYDTDRAGFASPSAKDSRRYFLFETSAPGNSNAGHNYPWAIDDPERDPAALSDLLAYLKTL